MLARPLMLTLGERELETVSDDEPVAEEDAVLELGMGCVTTHVCSPRARYVESPLPVQSVGASHEPPLPDAAGFHTLEEPM